MPIEFRCPSCGKLLRTPDESAGKQGKCPQCGTITQIPTESPAVPSDQTPPNPSPPSNQIQNDLFGGSAPAPAQSAPLPDSTSPQQPEPFGVPPAGPSGFSPSPNPYSSPAASSSGPHAGVAAIGATGARPHRGGMVLTFGLIGLIGSLLGIVGGCVCCFPVFLVPIGLGMSIPAWVMGQGDLKAMRAGAMDPSGMGNTQAGMITGIVGVVVCILALVFGVILFFAGFASSFADL